MGVMQNLLADTIELQPAQGTDFYKLGKLTLPSVVSGLIKGALVVAAIVFFFILVIGGIRWIASGGDKAATEGARNQITAALIGLVIVFAAWAIVALINTFFGINIFSLTLPTV
jgi:pseudouridine-5'-phosphate glycosidase